MNYFGKVNYKELIEQPQQRIINNIFPSIDDIQDCFDKNIEENHVFKSIDINKNYDECYDEFVFLDKYLKL